MATLSDFMIEWESTAPFITAHTSGSTGTPKEIRLLKSDMRKSAQATNRFFGISQESTLGIPLSMDYIAGKMMAVRAIESGARLVEFPVSNHIRPMNNIDLLSVVPSQLEWLLEHHGYLAMTKSFLVGGAAVSKPLEDRIKIAGINAYAGYGMTETCSHVALRRLGSDCPAYQAMPNITFSSDERGCLVIESDMFSWKCLVTNDIAEVLSTDRFIWKGRADNIINSGGIKVCPEEIEAKISAEAPVALPPFYISSRESTKWGNEVVMVTEPPEDIYKLINTIKALTWRRGWRPAAILVVEKLPRTSNGKVRRVDVSQICLSYEASVR
ncbi:MAG: AMP-binding protein [Odoribacter sp.]|nr:AMP-binding protein [Odoribacter sp.]